MVPVMIKLASLPVLVVVLAITFGNPAFLQLFTAKQTMLTPIDLKRQLLDPEAGALLSQAGVKFDSPIAYVDGEFLMHPWNENEKLSLASHPNWLPAPISMLTILPNDRVQTYLDRFFKRYKSGGWILYTLNDTDERHLRVYELLNHTHVITVHYQSAKWGLSYYEPR
jgi:hypothetical protein